MESFAQKFEHHQQDKRFHPFTCGNDACNQTHAHAELYYDELFDKLRCHYCDYEQDVPDYLEELLELLGVERKKLWQKHTSQEKK